MRAFCEMGFIRVRNGPFRGAILGISGAEMGHIRGRNGPFRRTIRRRSDCNKTQVADCQCHTQPSQNSRICGRRDGCSKKRAYFRVMGEYLFISMSVFSYIYSFSYDVPVCLSVRRHSGFSDLSGVGFRVYIYLISCRSHDIIYQCFAVFRACIYLISCRSHNIIYQCFAVFRARIYIIPVLIRAFC